MVGASNSIEVASDRRTISRRRSTQPFSSAGGSDAPTAVGTSAAPMASGGEMSDRRRAAPWLPLVTTAVLGVLVSACSGAGAVPPGDISHPAGDALVLRVTSGGGFLAPAASFSQLPSVSVYGDGR